jgi:lysozyme
MPLRDLSLLVGVTVLVSACAPSGAPITTRAISSSNTDGSQSVGSTQPAPTTLSDAPVADSGVTKLPPPVIIPRASTAANLKVCPADSDIVGVDVSDYDPGTNWLTVKSGGRPFAFIKATEGITYISPLFAGDWSNAKRAGVIRGAYHFFHADDDATSQANVFIKTLGTLNANDLAPVLDWELGDGVANAKQIAAAKVWLQLVEAATGRIPILYTGVSFWNSLGNPQGFERYPLFIANYETACADVPPPWTTWSLWQYSESAKITGVQSTAVDGDFFAGTLTDLTNFINTY